MNQAQALVVDQARSVAAFYASWPDTEIPAAVVGLLRAVKWVDASDADIELANDGTDEWVRKNSSIVEKWDDYKDKNVVGVFYNEKTHVMKVLWKEREK